MTYAFGRWVLAFGRTKRHAGWSLLFLLRVALNASFVGTSRPQPQQAESRAGVLGLREEQGPFSSPPGQASGTATAAVGAEGNVFIATPQRPRAHRRVGFAELESNRAADLRPSLASTASEARKGMALLRGEDTREGGCSSRAIERIVNGGSSLNEFRIEQPKLGASSLSLKLYEAEDCSVASEGLSLEVTQYPNNTDVLKKSWVAIRINVGLARMAGKSRFICASEVGSKTKKKCIAQVTWPIDMFFDPVKLFASVSAAEGQADAEKSREDEEDEDEEDEEAKEEEEEEAASEEEQGGTEERPNRPHRSRRGSPVSSLLNLTERPTWVQQYTEKVNSRNDSTLVCFEWTTLFLGACFVLSCIHALYLLFTLPATEGKTKLQGLGGSSVIQLILSTLLRASAFLLGVGNIVSVSIRISLADAPMYVVDGIFATGVLLSWLGIWRLAQLLFTAQLYEVALLHGKCVLPGGYAFTTQIFGQNMGLSAVDLTIMFLLAAFSGCVAWGFYLSEAQEEELLVGSKTSWGSFTVLVQMVVASALQHMNQEDGMCRVKLRSLSTSTGEEESGGLLKHLHSHPKVELSIGKFCQLCREGRDPLNAIDADGEDPDSFEEGRKLGVSDVRWHARYIYKKTGSKATIATLPMCLGLMTFSIYQSTTARYTYAFAMPTLSSFEVSQGTLVPSFKPDIHEYTIFYPPQTRTMAFTSLADTTVARSKEFFLSGHRLGKFDPHDAMLSMDLEREANSGFPYLMEARVMGGSVWNSVGIYRFAMRQLEFLQTTILFRAGNWSRCVFSDPVDELHMPLPDIGTNSLSMEISLIPHMYQIPMSVEEWNALPESSYKEYGRRTTGVFETKSNMSWETCRKACYLYIGCLRSISYKTGCYYVMIKRTSDPESCHWVHGSPGAPALRGSSESDARAYHELLSETVVKANFCQGTWARCRLATLGVSELSSDGFLRVADIPRSASKLRNSVTYTFSAGSRARGGAQHTLISKRVRFWNGAIPPRTFFVAPAKGVKLEKIDTEGSMIVKFKWYPTNRFDGKLRLLLVPQLEGNEFEMQWSNESIAALNIVKWDSHASMFDWSDCQKHVPRDPSDRYWVCRGEDPRGDRSEAQIASAVVVTLNPLDLENTISGWVIPRPGSNAEGLARTPFKIVFEADVEPSIWAIKDGCAIEDPNREIDNLLVRIDIPNFVAASNCSTVVLTAQEGTLRLSFEEFFIYGVRNAATDKWRTNLINTFWAIDPHLVRRVFVADRDGVLFRDGRTCTRRSQLEWETMHIGWQWFFRESSELEGLLCDLEGETTIRPRHIANAIRSIHTEEDRKKVLRALDCRPMVSPPISSEPDGSQSGDRDWLFSATSPAFASIRKQDVTMLKLLLDRYQALRVDVWVPSPNALRDPYRLGLLELAAISGCRTCVPPLLESYLKLKAECEGSHDKRQQQIACAAVHESRWLCFGGVMYGSTSQMQGFINTLSDVAKTVDVFRIDLNKTQLTNERFREIAPVWSSVPHLSMLNLAENDFDTCSVTQGPCLWEARPGLRAVPSVDDLKDEYASVWDAEDACVRMGQAVCQQVSCTSSKGPCRLHQSNATEEAKDKDSVVYTPNAACHEGVFAFLKQLPNLKALRLHSNKLCVTGLLQVAAAIPMGSRIEKLDISRTRIGRFNLGKMNHSSVPVPFIKFSKLLNANISENPLGYDGLLGLAPYRSDVSLQSLSAIDVGLHFEKEGDWLELAKKLGSHSDMWRFEIGKNNLGRGILELAPAFNQWPQLEVLDISFAGLDSSLLLSLAEQWKPTKLKTLRLTGNNLGPGGAQAVLNLLSKNEGLEALDLQNTSLQGGDDLLELMHIKTLTYLDLSRNRIPTVDIAKMLRETRHSTVTTLWIGWQSPEGPDTAQPSLLLYAFIEALKQLEELGLSGYKIPFRAFVQLTSLGTTKLRTLYLPEGISYVADDDPSDSSFMRHMPFLEVLDISFPAGNMTREVARGWLWRLSSLVRLKDLSIYGVDFHKEDWHPWKDKGFRSLRVLRGDFEPCDIQYLRRVFLRTAMKGRLSDND